MDRFTAFLHSDIAYGLRLGLGYVSCFLGGVWLGVAARRRWDSAVSGPALSVALLAFALASFLLPGMTRRMMRLLRETVVHVVAIDGHEDHVGAAEPFGRFIRRSA